MVYKIHTVDGQVYEMTASDGWTQNDIRDNALRGLFVTEGNFVPYHAIVRIEFV